jgi:hypothetical protein
MSAGVTCPAGTGASEVTTIDIKGGSTGVFTATGGLLLEVPPGALAAPTYFRVTELALPTPAGYTDYSPIYEISPQDIGLPIPAKLTIRWNIVLAPGAALTSPRGVTIYRADVLNGPWIPLMDSALNTGSSIASIDRFGYFFVGYPSALDHPLCRLAP